MLRSKINLILIFTLFLSFNTISRVFAYGGCGYGEQDYGIECDDLAPTGSININGGESSTTDVDVTLIINATDNGGTVSQMVISEDQNFNNASWEDYNTSKLFTLSDVLGVKTVYIKFRDEVGNISSIYYDQINYVYKSQDDSNSNDPSTNDSETNSPPTPTSYIVEEPEEPVSKGIYYKLRLVNKLEQPIADARIIISKIKVQAITDADGYINLGYIDKGDYEVDIEYNGKSLTRTINLDANNIITIIIDSEQSNNVLLIIGALGAILILSTGFIKLIKRN